jgi:uncharacterized delta-60 repeat protein
LFMLVQQALAQTGTLDPTFSSNGFVLSLIDGSHNNAYDIAVQSNGKVVVCGTDETFLNNRMLVARYTTAGALDPTFSGDGMLSVPIGFITDNAGRSVLVQPNNKILVAGTENTFNGKRMTVVRLQSNGALDGSFGSNGRTSIAMAQMTTQAYCMVLLADGSIVLGGSAYDQYSRALMAKVNTNGVEDMDFHQAVNIALDSSHAEIITSIVVLPNGRYLVSGQINSHPIVLRLLADGSLDSTFADGGVASLLIPGSSWTPSMVVRDDGRIVLVGYKIVGSFDQALAVQLDSTGVLDTDFGVNGVVTFATADNDDRFTDAVVLPNNDVIASGYILESNSIYGFVSLRRLDETGTLVTEFGLDGLVSSNLTAERDLANCMALQDDGKLLVAGASGSSIQQLFVARYRMDGDIGVDEFTARDPQDMQCYWSVAGLTISTALPTEDAVFTLFDTRGTVLTQSVWNQTSSGKERMIPTSLSPGVYIGQLHGPSGRQACKFVLPPH